MKQFELSIITVNYNGYDDTVQLIESLRAFLETPHEIIVVDNGSVTDEAALIKDCHPFVKTVRSDENLGFAGGNNLGCRHATGEYLLFLNNDTIVKDNSLHYLMETLRRNPDVAGVSPKILFYDDPGHIQFAGYTEFSPVTIRNRTIGYNEPDNGNYEAIAPTAYLHGAAMMIRREVIEEVGMMPECYFLYYEEMDWCSRMKRHGYRLLFDPRAVVYHKESSSTGKESPLKAYYLIRNRMLFAWRNRNGVARYFSVAYLSLCAGVKDTFSYLVSMKFSLASATCKGCVDFFGMFFKKWETK